jgi:hypothetical protein
MLKYNEEDDAEDATQIKDTIGFAECDCPEQIVSQKDCNAIFSNLSHDEEYFPMVARTEPEAFFGTPPPPPPKEIRPKAPEVVRSSQSSLSIFGNNPIQGSSTTPATSPPQSRRPTQSRRAQEIAQLKV